MVLVTIMCQIGVGWLPHLSSSDLRHTSLQKHAALSASNTSCSAGELGASDHSSGVNLEWYTFTIQGQVSLLHFHY